MFFLFAGFRGVIPFRSSQPSVVLGNRTNNYNYAITLNQFNNFDSFGRGRFGYGNYSSYGYGNYNSYGYGNYNPYAYNMNPYLSFGQYPVPYYYQNFLVQNRIFPNLNPFQNSAPMVTRDPDGRLNFLHVDPWLAGFQLQNLLGNLGMI